MSHAFNEFASKMWGRSSSIVVACTKRKSRSACILWLGCILAVTLFLVGCSSAVSSQTSNKYDDPYNAQAAIEYSYQYALERNEDFANFENNCTNFISQALLAGGKQMDEPKAPVAGKRIVYDNTNKLWYSSSIHTDEKRWKEFRVSTAFCNTEDFFNYWTNVRGMEFLTFGNSLEGLMRLYEVVNPGDVLTFFDADGNPAHLSIVVSTSDDKILVNANTADYIEHNILSTPADVYPKIGLLKIE